MATAVASPRVRLRTVAKPAGALAWVLGGVFLLALLAIAFWHGSRSLAASFWMDEGLSVGIASHAFGDIPGVLQKDGSPPLYYLLLNVWMDAVGTSESRTHLLSLIFSVLTVPVGLWAGWNIFSPRVGWVCAALCAINPFLAQYGQETRMYSLLALLGLLNAGLIVLVFVRRKRIYIAPLAFGLAAIMYTHGWGLFYAIGAAAAVVPSLLFQTEERRALVRDGLLSFGGAGLLFLPWLPTLLEQAKHTAAPWSKAPRFGAPIQISRGLLGGDQAAGPLVLGAGYGLAKVLSHRAVLRSRDQTSVITLMVLAVVTVTVAWILSQFTPAWTTRYFGVILGPVLLLAAVGFVRARGVGLAALAIVAFYWLPPETFAKKSNIRDISATLGPQLRADDMVISGQPEQMPALAYYFGADKRYAHTVEGKVQEDAYVLDWRDVVERYRRGDPQRDVSRLVASLRPGQHVLFVRPFTQGVEDWQAPWTELVRRRSAQWGRVLATDERLRRVGVAPTFYKGADYVGNSAVLYVRNR